MSAGLPQKYKDTKVEDVQSLFVFPTEGESTQTEYRLCGSFAFIDYNGKHKNSTGITHRL